MTSSPFPGPIAPENNPPIMPEWFQPSIFPITAISFGATTTVTTAPEFGVNNNFVIGQLVRFVIPSTYGAGGLNEQQAYVVGKPGPNQVIVGIDTRLNYDAFRPTPIYGPTPPTLGAIGDINTGGINSSGRVKTATTVPGTFINISPSAGG